MKTILSIDDKLYQEVKVVAARQGVSLSRFVEDGLRLRLHQKPAVSKATHSFRTYVSEKPMLHSWTQLNTLVAEEQEAFDFAKLGLEPQ